MWGHYKVSGTFISKNSFKVPDTLSGLTPYPVSLRGRCGAGAPRAYGADETARGGARRTQVVEPARPFGRPRMSLRGPEGRPVGA